MNIIVPLGVIVGGFVLIVIGVKAHTFYGVRGTANVTDKQVNPALGRTMFCIGGAVLMLIGLWALVSQLRQ